MTSPHGDLPSGGDKTFREQREELAELKARAAAGDKAAEEALAKLARGVPASFVRRQQETQALPPQPPQSRTRDAEEPGLPRNTVRALLALSAVSCAASIVAAIAAMRAAAKR